MKTYTRVHGKVSLASKKQGIHGVQVTAQEHKNRGRPVVTTLTRANGKFEISWPAANRKQTLQIHVSDRDGNPIATRRATLSPNNTRAINIRLPDAVASNHLSRPTTWRDTGSRLFTRQQHSEVRQAVSRIAPTGSGRYNQLLSHVLCPDPYVGNFDALIDLGWEVLTSNGDPGLLEQFRDTIQTLDVLDSRANHQVIADTQKMWDRMVSPEGIATLREGHRGANAYAQAPAFGPDILMPLLIPASQASGGRNTFARFVGMIFRQFFAARHLQSLHGAALNALAGDSGQVRHLENMLDMFGTLCGPDDGPVGHIPGDEHFPIHEVIDQNCLADLLAVSQHQVLLYAIYSIEPSRACENELVTLTGYGFDNLPQLVRFRAWGDQNTWIEVAPESWSNDHITARVPANAGCGLRLARPPSTHSICGRYSDLWPSETNGPVFEGGAAQILNFAVNHTPDTITVLPGDVLTLSWRTCAADNIKVEIVLAGDGSTLYELADPQSSGVWEQELLQCNHTTELIARVTVNGSCPPLQTVREISVFIHHLPALSVHGIEVTQCIQHYRSDEHLTDPLDQGADNSIQLVAGKTGFVRVYLRSGLEDDQFDDGVLRDVAGQLTVSRIVNGIPEFVAQLTPLNNPATIDAQWGFDSYDEERGDLEKSLNFLIPASEMHGRLQLTAHADVTDLNSVPCGGGTAEKTIEVDVDIDQTLNIVAVPVRYEGPPFEDPESNSVVTVAAPNQTAVVNSLSYSLKILPVNETPTIRRLSTITIDYPLDGERTGDGGCSQAWYRFLAFDLLPVKLFDGSDPTAIYLGFLSADLPKNPTGCATFGVTGASINRRRTIAHEIAHVLGRPHAPRGDVGFFDSEYPAYEPYDDDNVPNGSIGEYGVDTVRQEVHHPSTPDLMAYASDRWMSLHNYKKLIFPSGNGITTLPVPAGSGGGLAHRRHITAKSAIPQSGGDVSGTAEPNPTEACIVITALIPEGGKLEVGHVSRVNTRRITQGHRSDVMVELIGKSKRVLSSAALYTSDPVGCSCCTGHGGDGDASDEHKHSGESQGTGLAMLNDKAGGVLLRARRGEKILWERKAPKTKPRLRLLKSTVSSRGTLKLSWSAKVDAKHSGTVYVRWSTNRRDWRLLAASLNGSSASIDVLHLPAGKVYLELLLQDGFYSHRVLGAITIPIAPPTVDIIYPNPEQRVTAGGQLKLWASVTSNSHTPITDEHIVWRLGRKQVGVGASAWIKAPRTGRHSVTCTVKEGRKKTVKKVGFESI
ncbi:MAG: hypothetical protein AB8G18_00695 [Gammaproteobacteria bacterium]